MRWGGRWRLGERACLRPRAARGTQHAAWTPQKTVNPLATRCVGVGSAVCSPPAKHTHTAPRSSAHASQLFRPWSRHLRVLCGSRFAAGCARTDRRHCLERRIDGAPSSASTKQGCSTQPHAAYTYIQPASSTRITTHHIAHTASEDRSARVQLRHRSSDPCEKNQACLSRPILTSSRHAAPNALRGSSRLRRA